MTTRLADRAAALSLALLLTLGTLGLIDHLALPEPAAAAGTLACAVAPVRG